MCFGRASDDRQWTETRVCVCACVQIELFFKRGNRVIRRNIYRDNKSSWMLDGRDATLKAVTRVMEDAKIQIDNLCQFLPQDKVGEFSRMNPVQLLKATETAIVDGDLATTHDKIIELQTDMTAKERVRESATDKLEMEWWVGLSSSADGWYW